MVKGDEIANNGDGDGAGGGGGGEARSATEASSALSSSPSSSGGATDLIDLLMKLFDKGGDGKLAKTKWPS